MWKQSVNSVLRRSIGYQLTRPPGHPAWRLPPPRGERLLTAPVFIFSAARSGSTLLRSVLGAHSQLYAPPELPLGHLEVRAESRWIQTSMKALRLTDQGLQFLLWDRVLADLLARSGKPTVVVKTPSNVLIWERISACWPDARFIFLLRHPAAAVRSLHAAWNPEWHPGEEGSLAEAAAKGLHYMTRVQEARTALPGFTVRYEELTAAPAGTAKRLCEFLGVTFEPGMLSYGRFADHHYAPGLGDASRNIRSGQIQAPVPPPRQSDIPAELAGICAAWGYLDEGRLGEAEAPQPAPGPAREQLPVPQQPPRPGRERQRGSAPGQQARH